MGKQTGAKVDAEWGSIQILVFAAGTEMPADKLLPTGSVPIANADRPVPITPAVAQKQ
jgi:hypothetical protein